MTDEKNEIIVNEETIMERILNGDFKPIIGTTFNSHNKKEAKKVLQKLIDDREELQILKEQNKQNEMLGDKIMDPNEMKILENNIDKMLNEKFKEFNIGFNTELNTVKNDIGEVKEQTKTSCANGECNKNKLAELEQTLNDIAKVVSGDHVTSKIKELDEKLNTFDEKISNLNGKVKETCDGVDCIKNRMDEQDDTFVCQNCGESFLVSQNMVGSDKVICPNCNATYNVG